jgi:peptidoglycan hydrolase-like protein with peptidoglycan-binding domain
MGRMMWFRLLAGGVVAASALVIGGTANAATVASQPHAPDRVGIQTVQPAVTCSYSTNSSQSFTFGGATFVGFGHAGHYSGTTAVPSKTQDTSAGEEAQCLLVRYGDYNPGGLDGVFGPNSQAAMRKFQQDMNSIFGAGLSVDGLPGPHTWPWLRWWEQ